MNPPLLIEIGCEEIPARAIPGAAVDLAARLASILDQAGLAHGAAVPWGGTRRLAVSIEEVAGRQPDREEEVLGPPASAAFDADGSPTSAALGFARKQGVDPGELKRVLIDKGAYVGLRRKVAGRSVGDVLAAALPAAVSGMSFPKTMRWGTGLHRWVRPVHWLLALHGAEVLPLEVFGVHSGRHSRGHRFLAPAPVEIPHASDYVDVLRAAYVLVDPVERRNRLRDLLHLRAEERAQHPAAQRETLLVEDDGLLEEVADLVEWPGVVVGTFPALFLLELPEEVVQTTLRHHQKAFSVRTAEGPDHAFLSVANTDRDPAGHIRRGCEWVVHGRLEDALFHWREDRNRQMRAMNADLSRVTFHAKVGSYEDKVRRMAAIAEALGAQLGLTPTDLETAVEGCLVCKADLVSSLVGEFPELQGVAGGLLLRAEGASKNLSEAVYEHYKPSGAEDSVPSTIAGAVVSLADKLDTTASLLAMGEVPTGSRDPLGLRRAITGVFRIVETWKWNISIADLWHVAGEPHELNRFLQDRYVSYTRERGYSINEIFTVLRPKISPTEFLEWPLGEIVARLEVVKTLRGSPDFARLVELTKRVDNILAKQPEVVDVARQGEVGMKRGESQPTALELERLHDELAPAIRRASESSDYSTVIELLGRFVDPVAKFFDDVLVLDPNDPGTTYRRCDLLEKVRGTITQDFDIRELAGQAERRAP